jgi:hypothetical protein
MGLGMIAPSTSSQHARSDTVARLAISVATACMVVMPLSMWLASRSAPLVLALAAIGCLIALAREPFSTGLAIAAKWRPSLASPCAGLALGLGGFLLLALVSILWSHDRAASLRVYGELCVSLAAGAVVAAVLPGRAPRWAGPALAATLILACLMTAIELSGMNVWRLEAGLRAMTFIFNRSLILALALALPLAAWLAATRRFFLLVLLMGAVAGATILSESGAAKLGLLAVVIVGLAASLAPRLTIIGAAAGLVALTALAPVQGEIADRTIPSSAHRTLQDAHSRDRVDIWLAYGQAIRERPLFGSGFGTSATLDRHPVAQALPPAERPWLSVGHPHSAEVQIWVETGLAGAFLLLFAGLNLLVLIGRMEGAWRVASVALFAGALAIAAVGHGAWQGWWIAALGASIAWFRVLRAQSRRDALSGTDSET